MSDEPEIHRAGDPTRRKGQALVLALVFIVVMATFIGLMLSMGTSTLKVSGEHQTQIQLQEAARGGLAKLRVEIFDSFQQSGGGDITATRAYLTALGLTAGPSGDLGGALTRTMTVQSSPGPRISVTATVRRSDDPSGYGGTATFLVLQSIASTSGPSPETWTVQETARIGGTPFKGFEYAVLANQINCIFCHTRIDNVDRYFDPSPNDNHDRARVASLESLKIALGGDSQVAGTIYANGALTNYSGTPLANIPGGAGGTQAVDIDNSGKIQDPDSLVAFSPVTNDANGVPQTANPAGENFYRSYPTMASGNQIDGDMPDEFPPIVPDTDAPGVSDRVISQAEWDSAVTAYTGTIQGAEVIHAYKNVTGSSWPSASTNTHTTIDATSFKKSKKVLYLEGTQANPIKIDGNVAINGDVVIKGYVVGEGQLLVNGNMYLVGDLKYKDTDTNGDGSGSRVYGENDGSTGVSSKNMVAWTATGNIMHGNVLYNKGGNVIDATTSLPQWTPTGSQTYGPPFYSSYLASQGVDRDRAVFTMSEIAEFNRGEWTKAQAYVTPGGDLTNNAVLADVSGEDRNGDGDYTDPGDTPIGVPIPNAAYQGSSFVPRYYVINSGEPAWMFKSKGGLQYLQWDNINQVWKHNAAAFNGETLIEEPGGSRYEPYGRWELGEMEPIPGGGYAESVLAPEWISNSNFGMLMLSQDAGRPPGPYEVDGLLYTNNSILFKSDANSSGEGMMTVNGAMVSADMGILVPGKHGLQYDYQASYSGREKYGLIVNYDVRTRNHLVIEQPGIAGYWVVARKEF